MCLNNTATAADCVLLLLLLLSVRWCRPTALERAGYLIYIFDLANVDNPSDTCCDQRFAAVCDINFDVGATEQLDHCTFVFLNF